MSPLTVLPLPLPLPGLVSSRRTLQRHVPALSRYATVTPLSPRLLPGHPQEDVLQAIDGICCHPELLVRHHQAVLTQLLPALSAAGGWQRQQGCARVLQAGCVAGERQACFVGGFIPGPLVLPPSSLRLPQPRPFLHPCSGHLQ